MTATANRTRVKDRKPQSAQAATRVAQDRPSSEELHADLDAARRRWLAEGDTAECVAEYARVLRALLRESHPSSP